MEEMKKDIEVLKEGMTQRRVVEHQILDIVERTENKVDGLTGSIRSVQVHEAIADTRLNALDAHIGTVDASVHALAQDLVTTNNKLDQILALLRKPE